MPVFRGCLLKRRGEPPVQLRVFVFNLPGHTLPVGSQKPAKSRADSRERESNWQQLLPILCLPVPILSGSLARPHLLQSVSLRAQIHGCKNGNSKTDGGASPEPPHSAAVNDWFDPGEKSLVNHTGELSET